MWRSEKLSDWSVWVWAVATPPLSHHTQFSLRCQRTDSWLECPVQCLYQCKSVWDDVIVLLLNTVIHLLLSLTTQICLHLLAEWWSCDVVRLCWACINTVNVGAEWRYNEINIQTDWYEVSVLKHTTTFSVRCCDETQVSSGRVRSEKLSDCSAVTTPPHSHHTRRWLGCQRSSLVTSAGQTTGRISLTWYH